MTVIRNPDTLELIASNCTVYSFKQKSKVGPTINGKFI